VDPSNMLSPVLFHRHTAYEYECDTACEYEKE